MKLVAEFLQKELNIKPAGVIPYFQEYEKLLLDWNTKINLMSRKTESIESHILNSIFFLKKYPLEEHARLIDIGTGGGFPGIPLKILYPGLDVTLADSIQKKVNVLSDIVNGIGLKGIKAVWGRAETLSEDNRFKNKYDIITAKSVAVLDKLYFWNKNFLNKSGKMLYIKGGDIQPEIQALVKTARGIKYEVMDYHFPAHYGIEDKKLVILT